MSSRPPPIPRKTADNVVRAREQLKRGKAIAENRARIPVARSRQVLSQGETDRVERLFQSRNELDAFKAVEERNNERQRNAEFQERRRQTGLTSKQLAIARKVGRERSEEIKKITPFVNRKPFELSTRDEFDKNKRAANAPKEAQILSQEILITALAKRKFGGGFPDLTNLTSETDVKDFLTKKYGGEQNAKAQAELFGKLLGNLPLPRRAGSPVIATKIRTPIPQPQPEPEPEPEPEFISPPPPPLGTEARARPQPIGARDNRPMSERSTANFEANAFQPNTAGGGQRLADSVIQNRGTF